MRNAISILSAAVLLAACGEKTETTAPATRLGASPLTDVQSLSTDVSKAPPAAAAGKGGLESWTYVSPSQGTIVLPGTTGTATIKCPAGTVATGGGFTFDWAPPNIAPFVETSSPDVTGTGWIVRVRNFANSGGNAYPRAIVRCTSLT